MKRKILKYILGLSLLGSMFAFTSREKAEVLAEEPTCVGTVSISKMRTLQAYADGNPNNFVALFLSGSDYPDVDGTPAKQNNNAFDLIGNGLENFSHLKMNGEVVNQTGLDLYANMWTYHPIFTMSITNSGSLATGAGTFEISKDFRIPTYETMCGRAKTYFTVDRNYKFTKPNGYTMPALATFSNDFLMEAESNKLGDVTIDPAFAYNSRDPGDSTSYVIISKVIGADYLKASPNQAFSGKYKDDVLTNMKVNNKLIGEYTRTRDPNISMWTAPVQSYFGFGLKVDSSFTLKSIKLNKGTKLPSSNGVDYFEVAHNYGYLPGITDGYVNLDSLYSFVDTYLHLGEDISAVSDGDYYVAISIYNAFETPFKRVLMAEDFEFSEAFTRLNALVTRHGDSFAEDLSIVSSRDLNLGTFAINKAFSKNIDGSDDEFLSLVVGEGLNYGSTSKEVPANRRELLHSVLNSIDAYDVNNNLISLDYLDAEYLNYFGETPSIALKLKNLAKVSKITLKAGLILPSYELLFGSLSDANFGFYTLETEVALSINKNAKHEANSINTWAENVCQIIYLNEQGNPISNYAIEKYDCGVTVTLRGTPYLKGHSGHWVIEGIAKSTLNGQKITLADEPETVYVKCVYEARSYTLSFEGLSNTVSVTYGQVIGDVLPEVSAPTGYDNARWEVDGVTISKDYVWDFDEDKTATIAYDVKVLTVTFMYGYDDKTEIQSVSFNECAIKPASPVRESFVFVDWYLDQGFNQVFDFNTVLTDDVTLYAKWTSGYKVTFDTNGGSLMEPVYVFSGEKVEKPYDPSKDDATFLGWYLGNKEFDFNTPITGDITLVAKWKENETVNEEKGCGGSIASASLIVSLVSLTGVMLIKRRKEN